MIPVTIRPYKDEDFPAVCRLEEAGVHESRRSAVFVRQMGVISPDLSLVAILENEVVGYTIGVPVTNNPVEAWILRLGVREDQRRNGAGTILLTELMNLFRKNGVRTVRLTVSPWNVPAIGLYLKAGFEQECYHEAYFGKDEDRIIMKMECG
jgi:[ribosomal protein S18]-alanine N-acetyltransferase